MTTSKFRNKQAAFQANPSPSTALAYFKQGQEDMSDDNISDDTFFDMLGDIQGFLEKLAK